MVKTDCVKPETGKGELAHVAMKGRAHGQPASCDELGMTMCCPIAQRLHYFRHSLGTNCFSEECVILSLG